MEYCERVGEGLWSEPINAVTNLAFLIAAFAVARVLRGTDAGAAQLWDLWLLVALMAAVGVGSFLWHTLASAWSAWADVIPILLFINVYLLSFLVRVACLRPMAVLAWFAGFHVLNAGTQWALPADFLNGSVFYLPAWASLLLMAGYARRRATAAGRLLLLGAFVFTVSLLLRTLDGRLCPLWPLGTHFAWHLLNGLVLYLLTLALVPRRESVHRVRPFGPTAVG